MSKTIRNGNSTSNGMTNRGHDTAAFTYQKAGCDVVTRREKPTLPPFHQHFISLFEGLKIAAGAEIMIPTKGCSSWHDHLIQ